MDAGLLPGWSTNQSSFPAKGKISWRQAWRSPTAPWRRIWHMMIVCSSILAMFDEFLSKPSVAPVALDSAPKDYPERNIYTRSIKSPVIMVTNRHCTFVVTIHMITKMAPHQPHSTLENTQDCWKVSPIRKWCALSNSSKITLPLALLVILLPSFVQQVNQHTNFEIFDEISFSILEVLSHLYIAFGGRNWLVREIDLC